MHAPLLRNFYLSGSHVRSQCVHSLAKPCLSCELVSVRSCLQPLCMLAGLAVSRQAVKCCLLTHCQRFVRLDHDAESTASCRSRHVMQAARRCLFVCRMEFSPPATQVPRSPSALQHSCTPGGAMRTITWPATSSRTRTSSTCMPSRAWVSRAWCQKRTWRERLSRLPRSYSRRHRRLACQALQRSCLRLSRRQQRTPAC